MPKTTIPTKSTGDTLTAGEMNNVADALNATIDNSNPDNFYDVHQITAQYGHIEGDPIVFPVSVQTSNFQYTSGEFTAISGVSGYVEIKFRINVENGVGSEHEYLMKIQKNTGSGYADLNFNAREDIRDANIHTIGVEAVTKILASDKIRVVLGINPKINPEIHSGYAILKYVKTL